MTNNTKHKIKFSIFSIILAFAMMLTFNFSFVGAVTTYVNNHFALATDEEEVSEKNYEAKKTNTFDFVSSSTWSENYVSSTLNANENYRNIISGNRSLVGLATNNDYYPIAKYNGVPTPADRRTDITTDIDKLDNYGGVITLDNYKVARKEYKDDKFVTVNDGSKDVNKIYLKLTSATAAADLDQLITKVTALNTAVGYAKYEVINQFAENYESAAYATTVSSSSNESEYTAAINQVNAIVETQNDGDALYGFNLNDYELHFKSTYEFVENYMYLNTTNTTVELVNNSYYCLTAWVYTSGEATATLRIAGTNLDAKIENISTNSRWVQYYLFIESRSAVSTNARIYLYYGNTDGITGPRTLESYNTGVDQYDSITGTVVFDDINIYSINYADYSNRTINGKQPNAIAQTNIADGYTAVETANKKLIKNSSKATQVDIVYVLKNDATAEADLEDLQTKIDELNEKIDYNRYKVINQFVSTYSADNYQEIENPSTLRTQIVAEANGQVDGLDITTYNIYTAAETSNIDKQVPKFNYSTYTNLEQLSSVEYYSARYYKGNFENGFDANFDNTLFTTKAQLVYNSNNTGNLNFHSYNDVANDKYFTYYMPRYTSDSNTTNLSEKMKDVYRGQYQNNLEISVVAEADQQWNSFKRYVLNTKGEKIETGDTDEDGNPIYQTETAHNNTFANDNKILKLENQSESYNLGITAAALVVPANAIYKITVWAFSNDKDATATAQLFSSIKTKDNMTFGKLQITSATATEFEFNGNDTNGWEELNFYVKGNPTSTEKVYLVLMASAEDTVYFDNITVESVSSSSYSQGTNSINLATYGVLKNNIQNGTFNNFSVDTEDDTATYPYKAESWTVEKDDGVISGIISANDTIYTSKKVAKYDDKGKLDYYDKDKITVVGNTVEYDGNPIVYGTDYLLDYSGKYIKATTLKTMFGNQNAPTTLTGNENVYAVYLPQDTDFKLTSNNGIGSSNTSSSLSSNSVYKVTTQVWFANNFNGNLKVSLIYSSDGNKTISEHYVDNPTKNTWVTFTFYVRTANSSQSEIKIEFDSTETTGTFFIQNVNNTEIEETTDGNVKTTVDEKYTELLAAYKTNEQQQASLVRFVDLANNNFTMHSAKADTKTNIYDAYSYKLETPADDATYKQGKFGVIKLGTGENDGFKFAETDPLTKVEPKAGTTDNPNTALLIYNTGDADYTLANPLFNNTLSSSKFYKVTFDVYTCADLDASQNQGLTVSANGFDDTNFKNINTNGEWKTYTFYFRTGSDSVTFSLTYALGDKTEGYTGWALVSNMQYKEIEEKEYTADTTNETILNDNTVVIKSLYTESSDNNDDEKKEDKAGFSWQTFFLVFSSVLLVAALAVALVAVIVKRKKKKAKTVISADNKPDGGIA